MEHTVTVWDRQYTIEVYQNSKNVWIAVGDYMGQRIEVKSRSSNSASALWKDAARYKGN